MFAMITMQLKLVTDKYTFTYSRIWLREHHWLRTMTMYSTHRLINITHPVSLHLVTLQYLKLNISPLKFITPDSRKKLPCLFFEKSGE